MRRKLMFLVTVISCASAFTFHAAQQATVEQNQAIVLQGNRVAKKGATTSVRGNVTVKTDALELHANEVNFNSETRVLEARGKVTVRSIGVHLSPGERLLLANKRSELAGLRLSYGPTWITVKRLEAEIAAIESQSKGSDWSMQTDTIKMQLPSATPVNFRIF
jgi:hypothetical protein